MPEQAKPVLVPVDFSLHSHAAAAFAADLSQRLKTPLVILHVAHDPAEAPGYYDKVRKHSNDELARIEDKALEAMQEFLERAQVEHPDLATAFARATPRVVVGLPVGRILEVVEQLDPSMVVMGSLGRTGLARLYIGSKAEQVVRLCPAPVTIVKTAKP